MCRYVGEGVSYWKTLFGLISLENVCGFGFAYFFMREAGQWFELVGPIPV